MPTVMKKTVSLISLFVEISTGTLQQEAIIFSSLRLSQRFLKNCLTVQIDWLPNRCATAFGYKKGDILSGNDSPVPGTDTSGATSIIKSYCKTDLVKQSCGVALDIKLYPDSFSSDNGIVALIALMDGFLSLGGFFMQLDMVDKNTLLEAKKNPQNYKTLSVRVSGWNARFVTLNEEWQNMIIERTAQNIN